MALIPSGRSMLSNTIQDFVNTTKKQVMDTIIPPWLSNYIQSRRLRAQQISLGPKKESNTVDDKEFNKAQNNLEDSMSSNWWNPFALVRNLFNLIFGKSTQDKVSDALNAYQSYAVQFDSFRFADRAVKDLTKLLQKRVSKLETFWNKIFGTRNKKVSADPIINNIKNTLKSWLQPYDSMRKGLVKGIPFTEHEKHFLENISMKLSGSSTSKYAGEIIGYINQILASQKSAAIDKLAQEKLAMLHQG